jgi:hypothetical protein
MRERLSLTLTLTVGGVAHEIAGGNIRAFSLRLTSYGAAGTIEFVQQDDQAHGGKYQDTLLADFVKPDLGEVSFAFSAARTDASKAETLPEIKTCGLIADKSVTESTYAPGSGDPSVLVRRYRVRFVDAARLLWGQHHPCDLFTQKSFQDVLDAHKGAKITLSYDFTPSSAAVPLVFFNLDPACGASFYDLVIGYLRDRSGVLTYDHTAGAYSIKAAKDQDGTASPLFLDDVLRMTSTFPEIARHKLRVVNSYTEAIKQQAIDNAQAVDGLYCDTLVRTPIAQEVDDRVAQETARPLVPARVVEMELARYPTTAVAPGSLLEISKDGGGFSGELIAASEPFRVFELMAEGGAADSGPEEDYGDKTAGFELSLRLLLEAKSDPVLRLPSFVRPRFPGLIEGKVVSTIDEDTDVTYEISQDADTSVDQYKVTIPLFADQEITVPFEPPFSSGTLYLPLYKKERVLLAFQFDRAEVVRLLDYRDGARVPQDGQGQHLMFGKSAKSNTSVLHDYQDQKPVLRILRTNDKDTALFRLEEGKMTLQVKETEGG